MHSIAASINNDFDKHILGERTKGHDPSNSSPNHHSTTQLPHGPLNVSQGVSVLKVTPHGNGYVFDDRYFQSYQEVQCYRYLRFLGIPPGKMHREYRVGHNRFDFFPLKRVFWEHHPINMKLGKDIYRYGKKRRAILDGNGYAHVPLVVSDLMFEDVPDICQKMSESDIDFRSGRVPKGTGILYVHGFERDYERHCFNTLHETLAF
jgi:hypothetical protein